MTESILGIAFARDFRTQTKIRIQSWENLVKSLTRFGIKKSFKIQLTVLVSKFDHFLHRHEHITPSVYLT